MARKDIDDWVEKVLTAVYMGGAYEESYGVDALTDGSGPDVEYETLSVSEATKAIAEKFNSQLTDFVEAVMEKMQTDVCEVESCFCKARARYEKQSKQIIKAELKKRVK